MSKNREINIATEIQFIGSLNHNRTVHLATSKSSPDHQYVAKAIYLGPDFQAKRKIIEGSLRKLYGSNHITLTKPELYGFDEQNSYIYLFSPVYGISVQNLIMHHKKIGKPIQPTLVYNFACKLYDCINRLKNAGTDFFHQNLKPSNIFYQVVQSQEKQIVWKVSECGLLTNYPNKFYRKMAQIQIMKNKSNLSFLKDHFENDLYSLGVILLEMITLVPIQKIYTNLQTQRTIDTLQEVRKNQNIYGPELIDFIKILLHPKQQAMKQVFRKYKQYPPQFIPPYSYHEICWNFDKFKNHIEDKIYQNTIAALQEQIKNKDIKCQDVLQYAQKYDPDLNFYFTEIQEMELFLRQYGVDFMLSQQEKEKQGKQSNSFRKLYSLGFYLLSCSTMNYVQIIKEAFPTKDILEAIIKKAIENYRNRKQFFQAQTGGREFWKAEDIHKFMGTLGVYLNEKNITEVVKQWAGLNTGNNAVANKRNSIKYDEFSRVFKDTGKQGLSTSRTKTNKTVQNEKTLSNVLEQIKNQVPNKNLVSFFRSFDLKGKWVVGQSIQQQLKKYVKISNKLFKEVCQEMWQIAGVTSGRNKILQYVTLLKNKKIYEPLQLFKLVLTQKINETNRQQFFNKYKKDDEGWNYLSLMDFNHDQMLDFDQRELRMLFNEMDKDSSKYLSENQLIFQLTGLKQFDLEFLVEKIKQQIRTKRIDLFSQFTKEDVHNTLCLNTPGDIATVFTNIGLQIPANHYDELFSKYQRGQKFDYLIFLRYFEPLFTLYRRTCIFIIDSLYKGNFEKFYALGLAHNHRKWNRNSLVKINEEMVLCFTENEIGQIWKNFDPHGDGSLTKKQVAEILSYNYNRDGEQQQQSMLPINSSVNFLPNESSQKFSKKQLDEQKNDKNIQQKIPNKNQTQKTEFIKTIQNKNLKNVAECFVKKSRTIGSLTVDQFCSCLSQLQIPHLQNVVLKQTKKFQYFDSEQKSTKINFVSLLMFLCQKSQTLNFAEKSDDQNEMKAEILLTVLKEIIKNDQITMEQVFLKCRKDKKMKITDYENFVKKTLKVDIYFDDIEATWRHYGEPNYLEAPDLQKLLKYKKYESQRPPPLNKGISFNKNDQREDYIRQSFGKNDGYQSPHFPVHMKSRKSSRQYREDNNRRQQKRQSQNNFDRKREQRAPRQVEQKSRKNSNNFAPPKSNRISLDEQKRKEQQQYYRQKQKKEQERNYRQKQFNADSNNKINKKKSKADYLDIFAQKIQSRGLDDFNELYSKSNNVSTQKFAACLRNQYNFEEQQANIISDTLGSFGKVKIENVRKYLRSPEKKSKANRQQEKKREEPQTTKKSSDKMHQKKQEPVKNQTQLQLTDLKKVKLNVPLIKQHIRILISSFSKKFSIHQMQPFFFEGSNNINQQKFIEKCTQINPSISTGMYRKIFLYLKPTAKNVSSISFKLNFSYDQEIQFDQSYLPEELEAEIKAVFQKADKSKNGYIQNNQVEELLSGLGLNQTQKQIENYFQKIDQNFDKKISFPEFRTFIQDNIISYVSDFDEDSDHLLEMLKMNDIFKTGALAVPIVGGVLQKYGVKLTQPELVILSRFLANQNGQIIINDLIFALYYPSHNAFPPALKSVLYKIRWKRKITFRELQKTFESISTCFVNSYTYDIMKSKILTPSAFITPVLSESQFFYKDYIYKNPINKLSLNSPNLVSEILPTDIVVQLRFQEATGLPIPQAPSIKNNILSRTVNIAFFDTSQQQAKQCITTLYKIEFDPDVEDVWTFSKNNKSIFIKYGNYDHRKCEKILVLIEFIISVCGDRDSGNSKVLNISCGSCSVPLRELSSIDGKINKKYKIIGGIPNKSKQIDKMSVSKRKGWRGFISNQSQSQLNLQIMPQSKFTEKIQFLAGMPEKVIVNRKNLEFYWTFREFFSLRSIDGRKINPDFCYHFFVKAFLMSLDIPDTQQLVPILWKQKIQPKIQKFEDRMVIIPKLLSQLFIVINSKQFEVLPSFLCKSTLMNKSLQSTRQKLITEIFNNIEAWASNSITKQYKRKKAYNCDITAFKIQQKQLSLHAKSIAQKMMNKI